MESVSAQTTAFSESKPVAPKTRRLGRDFKRHFTNKCYHPYETVEWEFREAVITGDHGNVIFTQRNVETPSFWSQMATNIVASKYLHGELNTPERESGIKSLINRVVGTISKWGEEDLYFTSKESTDAFSAELTHILLHQMASFNSPVWFNLGIQAHPQCSACFILSVEDTMDSLLELQQIEGKLFKYGSGTGTNLSTLRSTKDVLSGGGRPSGPVSFMRAFDGWAAVIKSGGKTRRAAKMQILNVNHPDILEFIRCKSSEEKKAWALINEGYDGSFAAPGGAYESVAFQNANLSVRVDDEFMRAVDQNGRYSTRYVATGEACTDLSASDVMREIAQGTWLCGDPGIQFDTTINRWHTCPASGRINASNPCSEYMHLDNSACNLASINLLKFLCDEGTFDVEGFCHTVDTLITAQDILIDRSSYPIKKIGKCAHDFRQLGLGYANLGALLMSLGIPYDSDIGRSWAANITSLMSGQAYKTSSKLAESCGAFEGFRKNRTSMLNVIEMHRDAATRLNSEGIDPTLVSSAREIWNGAVSAGKSFGFRNSQVSVLAPTGTISFMMDCDTTGIEPDISLIKYKKLVGGGYLKLVNSTVVRALTKLGYVESARKAIVRYIDEHGTIEGAPEILPEHLPVFDCAFKPAKGTRTIHYMGHLKMMAAVQPFISGAISKTVNIPNEATANEIYSIYIDAWKLGLKAVALYRDGSKRTQPLSSGEDKIPQHQPVRRRLPDERSAITHKFTVGGLEGYLTVGLYDDGTPGEIFIVVAKEGSTLSGIMDAFATSISIALQFGVPLTALIKKFAHMRFEPAGFTSSKDIPIAKSIVDYIFRWLAIKFLQPDELLALGLAPSKDEQKNSKPILVAASSNGHNLKSESVGLVVDSTIVVPTFQNSEDAPPCTVCGSSMMVRQAGCYVCLNCGAQGGCG